MGLVRLTISRRMAATIVSAADCRSGDGLFIEALLSPDEVSATVCNELVGGSTSVFAGGGIEKISQGLFKGWLMHHRVMSFLHNVLILAKPRARTQRHTGEKSGSDNIGFSLLYRTKKIRCQV
jgi:hypothetical protein